MLRLTQLSKRKDHPSAVDSPKTRPKPKKTKKPKEIEIIKIPEDVEFVSPGYTPLSAPAGGPRMFDPAYPNRPALFPGERAVLEWSDDPKIPNVVLQEPMEAELAWDWEGERRRRYGVGEEGKLALPKRENKEARKVRVREERRGMKRGS